ncbi:MAG: V-type ATP synthase subunit D [Clostridiales bacterium]|nr:V-type ATP synthase subunit D [Clostridiales bacterium]
MPATTVNATRMELTRLKKKLATSTRGHKLLKDKRDEMMKQFLELVRENRALRKRVEEGMIRAYGSFTVASALMSSEMLEQSLLYPKQSVELDMKYQNIMGVNTPVYRFSTRSDASGGDIYPYGFATTSGELDGAVDALSSVFQDMLRLAQIEKATQLLAEEIEKTRRRVNALEYVVIPECEENIKYISMKLSENERNNTIRLMKVKDMMLAESLEQKRQETAKALKLFDSPPQ